MSDGGILTTALPDRDVLVVGRHEPKVYYQTRPDLCVWDDFTERIVEKAKSTEDGTLIRIRPFVLNADLSDEELEKELQDGHVFSRTKAAAVISVLVDRQPAGTEGLLFGKSKANLFYTKKYVVNVYECPDYHVWTAITWWRRVRIWKSGFQAFSLVGTI